MDSCEKTEENPHKSELVHARIRNFDFSFYVIGMIVRFLSGETVTMDIDQSNTVATLKKEIQSVTHNSDCRISLLMDGTILDDDKTIDYYRPHVF